MMNFTYKCKMCEYGPCYCHTGRKLSGSLYGDSEGEGEDQPLRCPYFSDSVNPDFEPVISEVKLDTKFCEEMKEWLGGEGYDNAPERLRDAILGFGFGSYFSMHETMKIIGLLREWEDGNGDYCSSFERDEWLKKFKKIGKFDLINAIFPEAFKAGVIFAEIERQKRLIKEEK